MPRALQLVAPRGMTGRCLLGAAVIASTIIDGSNFHIIISTLVYECVRVCLNAFRCFVSYTFLFLTRKVSAVLGLDSSLRLMQQLLPPVDIIDHTRTQINRTYFCV